MDEPVALIASAPDERAAHAFGRLGGAQEAPALRTARAALVVGLRQKPGAASDVGRQHRSGLRCLRHRQLLQPRELVEGHARGDLGLHA
ncbi:MAG: hypothetical protein ACK5QX_00215, partial [bacterium]